MLRVVGVDAWRGGWVAVELADGEVTAVWLATGLADIVAAFGDAAVFGVDMPLGLVARGWRQADELAAARLGAQRSRVFRVPPRPAWDAPTHREAVAVCRRLTEPPAGFSVQAWGLKDRLREADALRAGLPGALFEVHPELSFAALAGGTPVAAGKKTWNGQLTRRGLLAAAGMHLPDDLGAAGAAPADDILDAAAVAWSARRIAAGQAVSLPDPPQTDDAGQPMAIWY
jgi:predicted RNase H-like nuclease